MTQSSIQQTFFRLGKRDIQALPVRCPNTGCAVTMERQQLNEHVSKCLHAVVSCKYHGIGCPEKLKKLAMATHEQDDTLHLHLALDTVNYLQKNCILKNKKPFAISGYAKMKETDVPAQSAPFYTHPNRYHMTIEVDACSWDECKGTHLGVSAVIVKGEHDATLKWPFLGIVTITLLNQLEDNNHFMRKITYVPRSNLCVGDNKGLPHYISNAELGYNPAKNTQYLKDDTLYFRVEVEVDNYKPWLE